ncbi:MAG: hypothetical protein JJ858_09620 [Rhizobiaceae bacterium]|nr:hypothetical protein [Rhizobiaceae bacterium]
MSKAIDMKSIREIISPSADRPLIVCDIDEVVLEFLTPFQSFLLAQDKELRANSFALHGNIFDLNTNDTVENQKVSSLIEDFFADQLNWQMLLPDVDLVLKELSKDMDVIFLTAMPPHHFTKRKTLLEQFDLTFPLIATEDAKGPILKDANALVDDHVFFIDDMIYNHHSVAEHAPDTHHISIMGNQEFKAIAPDLDDYIYDAENWADLKNHIQSKI